MLRTFYDCNGVAVTPRIVTAEKLTQANSIQETGQVVSRTAGGIIAPLIMGAFGYIGVFVFNLVSYIFSLLGLRYYKNSQTFNLKETQDEQREKFNFAEYRQSLRTNLQILWRAGALIHISCAALCFNIAIGILTTLMVPFALENIKISVVQLGFISVPALLLSLAVPLVLPIIERKIGSWKTLVAAQTLAIFGMIAFVTSASLPGLPGFIIAACGLAILDVTAISALIVGRTYQQQLVSENNQAGVEGAIRTLTWGFDPIVVLLSGALSTYLLGREMTLWVGAAFLALGALITVVAKIRW